MIVILLNVWRSCFNVTFIVWSRIVLIILSALIYQSFVLAEVFLNSYNYVYPPYFTKSIVVGFNYASSVYGFLLKIIAAETATMNAFMRRFLRFLVSLLAIIVVPISYFSSFKRKRKCPPPTNPILFKSATKLADMIRKKQITSEEVVSAFIERCKEVNPYVNAVIEPRYEVALREARGIDKMIKSTDRTPEELEQEYPLLGIPLTIKESIAVEGMSNDCGTVYTNRNPAKKDAAIVRQARAAGAIPIAVTSTPQLCMNWETYNNVIGVTMNPYDPKRTTGGSSGGESALISSAASLIGLGSDMAGSLRLPPMFTGIYGHKPSPRLLSIEGHIPDCLDSDFEEYFTLGPLTRYAEDLALMLKVLKKSGSPDIPFDKPVDVSTLKFYYMEGDGSNVSDSIGRDVKMAMHKTREYLKQTYNIEAKPLNIKNIEHMWEISVRVLMNISHVRNIYTDPNNPKQWVSIWPEIIKKMFGLSNNNFFSVCYGPLKKFFDALPRSYYKNLLTKFEDIKTEFETILSDDAVLLFPTFPHPAHLHYRVYYKFLNCGYLTMFNALGLPVTACPIEMSKKGLPVGIQIAANRYKDHLTVAVAKEFEKAFGGWAAPNKDSVTV